MSLDSLLQNPVFSGLGAASIFGYVLYLARALPSQLFALITWRCTCSLMIFNEDEAYEKVNEWLSGLDYTTRCRKLRLATHYNREIQDGVDVLAPGIGNHFFWYRGRPILVRRTLPDKGGIGGWKRFEDIEIATVGTNPKVIQELVAEIRDARKTAHSSTVNVCLYRHRWRLACRKAKRALSSVVLPSGDKDGLIADIERFLGARKWYQEHGVPYRRGYLLEGPPGGGKTSLVLAVASHLERPIYALNLGSISNDDELIDAVSEVPEHGILLIEDIDAAKAGARRESAPESAQKDTDGPKEQQREVSLSALLNVIDGVFSREGRILFMTTNCPDKVDDALKRPGRSDRVVHIGELGAPEVLEMCNRFISSELDARRFARSVEAPISAAVLQERLVQHVRGTAA